MLLDQRCSGTNDIAGPEMLLKSILRCSCFVLDNVKIDANPIDVIYMSDLGYWSGERLLGQECLTLDVNRITRTSRWTSEAGLMMRGTAMML